MQILFYNRFFDAEVSVPGSHQHLFTTDRGKAGEADAIVFHLPSLREPLPAIKAPRQLWVAWSMESRRNVSSMADPRFMARFDLLMTFERGCDIWVPYGPDLPQLYQRRSTQLPAKTAGNRVAMFQSSRANHSGRFEYLLRLMAYLPIDSYGAVLNNCGAPQPDHGRSTKLEVFGRYRFVIAFENAIQDDYVTEKFFDPLIAGSIPIYLGAPNVLDFAPDPDCLVRVDDFESPKALAHHLLACSDDEALYAQGHRWRDRPPPVSLVSMQARNQGSPILRLIDVVQRRLTERAAASARASPL